jgi:hypothetical protein
MGRKQNWVGATLQMSSQDMDSSDGGLISRLAVNHNVVGALRHPTAIFVTVSPSRTGKADEEHDKRDRGAIKGARNAKTGCSQEAGLILEALAEWDISWS